MMEIEMEQISGGEIEEMDESRELGGANVLRPLGDIMDHDAIDVKI